MNQKALVKAIADELNMTQKEVGAVVEALKEGIAEALANGETVSLHGMGKFETVVKEEREMTLTVGSRKGERITVPERRVVKFSASKTLKDRM